MGVSLLGDDLTGALHISWLQLSQSPPSSFAPIQSRMETFWCQLTRVHLEKWPLKWRDREKDYTKEAGAGHVTKIFQILAWNSVVCGLLRLWLDRWPNQELNPGPPAVQASTVTIRLQRRTNLPKVFTRYQELHLRPLHCMFNTLTTVSIRCTIYIFIDSFITPKGSTKVTTVRIKNTKI